MGKLEFLTASRRAGTHPGNVDQSQPLQSHSMASLLRLFLSSIGLAVFNLFMVVPAGVFGSLLAALFTSGLACYIGGIALASSGLAGTSELVLGGPLRYIAMSTDATVRDLEHTRTRVTIDETGVHINQEQLPAGAAAGAGAIVIESDVDPDARTMQTLFGVSLVLGGIALLLLALVITRYTFIGIKRYVQMNIALLKGS
jgi:uncharacterized membrane protein